MDTVERRERSILGNMTTAGHSRLTLLRSPSKAISLGLKSFFDYPIDQQMHRVPNQLRYHFVVGFLKNIKFTWSEDLVRRFHVWLSWIGCSTPFWRPLEINSEYRKSLFGLRRCGRRSVLPVDRLWPGFSCCRCLCCCGTSWTGQMEHVRRANISINERLLHSSSIRLNSTIFYN